MKYLRRNNWIRTGAGSNWECYCYPTFYEGFGIHYLLHVYLDGGDTVEAALTRVVYGGPFGKLKIKAIYSGRIEPNQLEELLEREVVNQMLN